jgi:pimeloyl-ACP methyl ester carboxylesterase
MPNYQGLNIAALRVFCSALIAFATPTLASDYEREARFAELVKSQLVVGDAVTLAPPPGSPANFRPFLGLYAKGKADLPALVLAHGVGNHPDEGLTGSLRQRLHDMGYTTLAIQLPIGAKEATLDDYYPALFPEASSRLQAASAWLKTKGHTKVVLISHTMGSWMANVYLDQQAARDNFSAYQAWVCISLTGGYSFGVRNYPLPVLDVYGEQDIPVTVSAAWRRAGLLRLAATGSRQVMIAGADAQWRGKEQAAADAIAEFLRALPP